MHTNLTANVSTTYIFDTNIWLDWLVFSHDAVPHLTALIDHQRIQVIYTDPMLDELADVISRAQFQLNTEQQIKALQRVKQLAHQVETKQPYSHIRCVDPDDQVFIDTALAYRVDFLLSKDRHLLKMSKKAAQYGVTISNLDTWLIKSTSSIIATVP